MTDAPYSRRSVMLGAAGGLGAAGSLALLGSARARAEEAGAGVGPRNVIRDQILEGGIVLTEGHTHFENCVIKGGDNGIAVFGSASCTVSHCEISEATLAGIQVTTTGRVQILNNHIHHCGENGVRGVAPDPKAGSIAGNLLIDGNFVHDIEAPWGDGSTGNCITLWKIDDVQVLNNRCERSVYSSIRFAGCENTMMIGNYCNGSERDAQVYLEFAFFGGIVANNYIRGGGSGLSITNFLSGAGGHRYDGRQVVVTGNRLREQRQFGAKIEADVIFANNIIDGMERWAVCAGWGESVRNLQVVDNLIMNARWGVGLPTMKTSPVAVRGNRFYNVETPICGLLPNWKLHREERAATDLPADSVHLISDNHVEAELL